METSKRFTPEFVTKVNNLCDRIAAQSNAAHAKMYPGHQAEGVVCDFKGNKFVRILFDNGTQRSSRYFVEIATGNIYACSSWKKPNLNRWFGTLDETHEFDWSGYEARALPDSKYTMKVTRHYQTAVLKGTIRRTP